MSPSENNKEYGGSRGEGEKTKFEFWMFLKKYFYNYSFPPYYDDQDRTKAKETELLTLNAGLAAQLNVCPALVMRFYLFSFEVHGGLVLYDRTEVFSNYCYFVKTM